VKSPTALLLLLFCFSKSFANPSTPTESNPCHIEAFVAQVPTGDCQLETYTVVLKPSQPHEQFVQDLQIRIISLKTTFNVQRGMTEFRFELGAGHYQFEISDPAVDACRTIQQLTIKGGRVKVPPVAICKDISIQLGKGATFISGEALAGESYAACGPVSYQLSQSHFSSADVGTKEVEVRVKDARKKVASCKSQVTILPAAATIATYPDTNGSIPHFEYCGTRTPHSKAFFKLEDQTLQVKAGGKGVKDNTTIISQDRWGDGEIKVRLNSLKSLDKPVGQAGLIIGQNCDPQAAYCTILLEEKTGNIYKEFRLSKGGKVVREWEHRLHAPSWLKLKRKGQQFKAYTSHNGQHWQLAFSISMPVEQSLSWGMIVKNIAPAPRTLGVFEQLSIQTEHNSPYPRSEKKKSKSAQLDPFPASKLPDTYSSPSPKPAVEQEQWAVFPNPAQDYLEVTLPIWKDDHATLLLLNSIGKSVLEEKLEMLNGQSHWLNLAAIGSGIYYLKLQTIEGQHLTKKVVIDK